MKTKRHCLALDLVDDPKLIAQYKSYHQKVWVAIEKSITDAGVDRLEIYCTGNRLFMILEVNDDFSFEKKVAMDAQNPKVQEWEQLMWRYQKAIPTAQKNEKWVLMEKIYQLNK